MAKKKNNPKKRSPQLDPGAKLNPRELFFVTFAGALLTIPLIQLPASLPVYAPLFKSFVLKLFTVVLTSLFVWTYVTERQRVTQKNTLIGRESNSMYPLFIAMAIGTMLIVSSGTGSNTYQSLWGSYLEQEGFFVSLIYLWLMSMLIMLKPKSREVRILVNAVLASATVVSIIVILQYVFQVAIFYEGFSTGLSSRPRPTATLGNPVFLASYLVLAIPLMLGRLFEKGLPVQRVLSAAQLWLMVFALLATYTRGAWIAGVISVMVFTVMAGKKLLIERQQALAVTIIVLVFAIGAIIPFISSTSLQKQSQSSVSQRLEGGSIGTRLIMWDGAVRMLASSTLNGYGQENTGFDLPHFVSPKLYESEGFGVATRIHNDTLQRALDAGIMYVLLWVWLIVMVLRLASRLTKSAQVVRETSANSRVAAEFGATSDAVLIASISASVVGYIVAIQTSFTVVGVAPLFWALLGILWSGASTQLHRNAYVVKNTENSKVVVAVSSLLLVLFAVLTILAIKQVSADVLDSRANMAFREGQLEVGLMHAEAAERAYPAEPHYKFALASAYYNLVQVPSYPDKVEALKAAERLLKEIIQKRPSDQLSVTNLGNVYYALGSMENEENYNKALVQYERATELNPIYYRNYFFLGDTYRALGRKELAKKNYEKALELSPEQEDIKQALFLLDQKK